MREAASVAPAPAVTYGAPPVVTSSGPNAVTCSPQPQVAPAVTYMGAAPVASAPAFTYSTVPQVSPAVTYRVYRRGGSLPRMREGGTLKSSKEGSTGRNAEGFGKKFEVGGFMAQEWLWIIAKRKMRGALPREDGDLLREYQAIHEDDFLSSWLREDVEGKEEKKERLNKEAEEEKSQKWERRGGGRKGKG